MTVTALIAIIAVATVTVAITVFLMFGGQALLKAAVQKYGIAGTVKKAAAMTIRQVLHPSSR